MSIKVKALEWVENHGVAGYGPYRLFEASTPAGRFSYGTDSEGSPWWCDEYGGIFTVGDEEAARRMAEAAWTKVAREEVAKFLDPAPSPDMREAVEALTMLIYEITHLSAEDDKGRHHCYISKDALESARAAIRSLTGAKP